MSNKYKEWREEIAGFFIPENRVDESEKEYSPSGNFYLTVVAYSTGEGTWSYTQGVIRDSKNDKIIADVKRNFSNFWHSWIEHANGNEYLLCGEDYQGQTVVNLTKGTVKSYFPEAGFDGFGFCWTSAVSSSDSTILAVDGCYWACPYDMVFFDFRNPDELPFKELKRIEAIGKVEGWNEKDNFILEREIQFRKSDGKPYEELSDEEQDILDSDSSLFEYKNVNEKIKLSEIKANLDKP